MVLDKGLPHQGDIGYDVIIQVFNTSDDGLTTSIVDFTVDTLTSQNIIIRNPDGEIVATLPSSFVTDGSDGKIHAVLGNILDCPGAWTKQGQLNFSTGTTHHTQRIIFQVLGDRE